MSEEFDPLNPAHRFKRFLDNVHVRPPSARVLSLPGQRLGACQHCGLFHSLEKLRVHEEICLKNPRRVQRERFVSNGKLYVSKVPITSQIAPPDVRIASLVYIDSRHYAVLLDEILEIYLRVRKKHSTWIVKQGTFVLHGVTLVQFRVAPLMLEDNDEIQFLDEVDAVIKHARKMGASL